MKKLIAVSAVLGAVLLGSVPARAHCDTVDGPVARAATMALNTGNVNVVLPYAPAAAEAEITTVFDQVIRVRAKDGEARALADRFFVETVVRLHRQGENAPYTGVKPAGQDFGPVIPAAELALETGEPEVLIGLLTEAVRQQVQHRFQQALAAKSLPSNPDDHAAVALARERVHAEFGFVLYAEGVHRALQGVTGHAEGGEHD